MAVLDSNQTISNNVSGFDKGIHASARTMMLDNLQGTMYQRPIDSAVRESVCNGVDSVREKQTAINILTGKAKVEDHYLSKADVKDKIANVDDDIYQDSEFNPAYYDLKWLDPVNRIDIRYITNEQTKRDQFVISDTGVGLGGSRLEGFFSLGYSSKRLTSGEMGGFGLGAKSPLATGVDSYRVTSRYNGKEFCFDIYSHKVDCVYGKWSKDGGKNDYVEFKSVLVPEKYTDEAGVEQTRMVPYKAYYENTALMNGVTITIDVKKHNRQKYFDAVKGQLMYLKDDIVFKEVSQSGYETDIPFKATPIYEDDYIVLSDSGFYNKPHFIINDIAYGLIDFNEADLSQKYGNIGLKFKMESLKVLPTREGVQYGPKTNGAIVENYAHVSKTVEKRISDELKQEDLVEWLMACNRIMYGGDNSNVTSRLSQLAETGELKPVFSKDPDIKFASEIKSMITILSMQHIQQESYYDYKTSKQKKKIKREDVTSVTAFTKPLYYQFGPGSNRVTTYLASIHASQGGFCVFRVSTAFAYLEPIFKAFVEDKIDYDTFLETCNKEVDSLETDTTKATNTKRNVLTAIKFITLLKNSTSTNKVKIYDEKLVPENFSITEDESSDDITDNSEELLEQERKDKYKEILKRRKENKAFIGYKLANKRVSSYYYKAGFEREEIKSGDLNFEDCKIIYATDEDEEATNLLTEIAKHRGGRYNNEAAIYYWGDDLKILKVSKTNMRYVKSGTPINDYVLNVEDGVLRSTEDIRKAITAKTINEIVLQKCQFLRNFSYLNDDVSNSYNRLVKYLTNAPNTDKVFNKNTTLGKFFEEHAKVNLTTLKVESLTEEERMELIDGCQSNVFDLDILDVDLIEKDIYEEAKRLENFADVYSPLLKWVTPLSTVGHKLDNDLITELKVIIDSKKDQLEYKFKGINN